MAFVLRCIVRWAVNERLADHQRRLILAIVVNGVALDAMMSGSVRLFRCAP
jgi:hypothetical protein